MGFFDVVNTKPVAKLAASCSIDRADSEGPVDIEVDTQLNRVRAAEAIRQANTLARNSMDLASGRQVLAEAKAIMRDSPACEAPLCKQLAVELTSIEGALRDRETYEHRGKFAMAQTSQMHTVQRSNTSQVCAYKTSGKARMQNKWASERLSRAGTAPQERQRKQPATPVKQTAPTSTNPGMFAGMASFFGFSNSAPPADV